ncbi:bifunctional glutamate N-acetyltransferase/amino-acid acetyltransferase ArgJ [Phragmitibacter flavus]|uniref:Arginine biosynthesis bifunctional protein ArgJ n=1 Tax=Phragmitibacter flavus TaxID=2576071 RepID=A0A5R8KE92_9BACT|nr:bifunctional glutamate N-acetyltransferase/amino-acid acetyltransferase ArgJ [Phragmitibacter flavus]
MASQETELVFKDIPGGVTAAYGFRAGAISCGIKNPDATRLDLALVVSDLPTATEGCFTTNRVKAAPVRVSQQHIKTGDIRAVVANSGNANACTGHQGIADTKATTKAVAEELGVRMRQVLACSTGIIGMTMPMGRILPRIPELALAISADGSDAAAAAIMTSDTKPKTYAVEVECEGATFRIGGIAKGAGMICPNMATMLCVITTDAKVDPAELKRATLAAVEQSFNRITIDGDTSTNDTVIVMSNGASEAPVIKSRSACTPIFRAALRHVMRELAKMMVRDGERVTKFVEIRVQNARTYQDAKKVAETVAKSLLVKCSWHGGDPNWGRVIHAVGYSGARIREEFIDIYFGGLIAAKNGLASTTPVRELEKVTQQPEFAVTIDLNLGSANYHVFTTDLSEEFVDFNAAEYSAAVFAKRQTGLV